MHDPYNKPTPKPTQHRHDIHFLIIAAICYSSIGLFSLTQADPGLRLSGDLRFSIVLWLVVLGGTAGICWLARPQLVHLAFVFEVGRRLQADMVPVEPIHRRQLAARRAIWSTCGSVATAAFVLAGAMDIGVGAGIVNLHGQNLDSVAEVILSIGCITAITRFVGPALGEIDEVYRVAIHHAQREQGVASVSHIHAGR